MTVEKTTAAAETLKRWVPRKQDIWRILPNDSSKSWSLRAIETVDSLQTASLNGFLNSRSAGDA